SIAAATTTRPSTAPPLRCRRGSGNGSGWTEAAAGGAVASTLAAPQRFDYGRAPRPPGRPRAGATRRGAGAVERGGLENRCARKRTEGSNPSLSAIIL